jgi:hypothetical protein
MGVLVVAMSFVLIVGIPFTASYPYPIVNARELQNLLQKLSRRKVLFLSAVGISYLFLCLVTINGFTDVIYGDKYQVITNFSFGVIIAGLGLATVKYLSSIWRGLGEGLFGNVLQSFALIGTILVGIISYQWCTSWVSFYVLFFTWGAMNIVFSFIIITKIRKVN